MLTGQRKKGSLDKANCSSMCKIDERACLLDLPVITGLWRSLAFSLCGTSLNFKQMQNFYVDAVDGNVFVDCIILRLPAAM